MYKKTFHSYLKLFVLQQFCLGENMILIVYFI